MAFHRMIYSRSSSFRLQQRKGNFNDAKYPSNDTVAKLEHNVKQVLDASDGCDSNSNDGSDNSSKSSNSQSKSITSGKNCKISNTGVSSNSGNNNSDGNSSSLSNVGNNGLNSNSKNNSSANSSNNSDNSNQSASDTPSTGNGCLFINENDGRLQYTGLWTLEAKDPTGLTTTTHTTTTSGSQVSISFNGTSIIVVGVVHPSNATSPPAIATYTVDTYPSTTLPLPAATHDIPNQQFFQSYQLSPGDHSLLINVTSDGSPYTLDYLFFCGSGISVPVAATVSPDYPTGIGSKKLAAIVGGILGTLMLIFLIALVLVLCRDKRRKSRADRTASSPLRDWLQRRCAETIWTSSESILRNNPTNPSAVGSGGAVSVSGETQAAIAADPEAKHLPSTPRTYADFEAFDRNYSFSSNVRLTGPSIPFSPRLDDQPKSSPHPRPPVKSRPIPF